MSKWKNVRTYLEVNPYTGQPVEEDMPTNAAGRGAVAGIGVGPDGEPGFDPKKKKKKTLIDARSKSYKEHRMRLEKARQRREERKSKLAQKVAENIDNFAREKYLEEVNISDYVVNTLRDIKRSKSARNLNLKDSMRLLMMLFILSTLAFSLTILLFPQFAAKLIPPLSSNRQALGNFSLTKGEVLRLSSGDSIFLPIANNGQSIFEHDLIMTGTDGKLNLHVNNFGDLKILSLIHI